MKKLYLLATILIAALIAGCSNDAIVEESTTTDSENTTAKIIRLTTTMPDKNNTKLAFDTDENGVNLKWINGDKIYLIFDDGTNKGTKTVTLDGEDISNDGKTANFEIEVPDEISGNFTLYGVHGGGGFVDGGYELKLPTPENSIGESLEKISERNAVMIHFKTENVSIINPEISVKFEHIGSLFRVFFTNNAGFYTWGELVINLVGDSPLNIHQPKADASSTFDPFTGTVSNTDNNNNLPVANGSFNVQLDDGDTAEFWGWYIPQEGEEWPEVKANVTVGSISLTTSNIRPGRPGGLEKGKAYRFYVSYEKDNEGDPFINFTNSAGELENFFTDLRDLNVYKYVTIGNKIWMAENLRYIPDDAVLGECYLINGYNGNNVEEAIATDGYKTYGLYYTWEVAVAGNHNYNDKVQGVCPDGWHMPHSDDYHKLQLLIKDDGKKLKKQGTDYWDTDNGTDEYGFAGLGGGYYHEGELKEFKKVGAWWTKVGTHDENPDNAIPFIIEDNGTTSRHDVVNTRYHNVRCIRD